MSYHIPSAMAELVRHTTLPVCWHPLEVKRTRSPGMFLVVRVVGAFMVLAPVCVSVLPQILPSYRIESDCTIPISANNLLSVWNLRSYRARIYSCRRCPTPLGAAFRVTSTLPRRVVWVVRATPEYQAPAGQGCHRERPPAEPATQRRTRHPSPHQRRARGTDRSPPPGLGGICRWAGQPTPGTFDRRPCSGGHA